MTRSLIRCIYDAVDAAMFAGDRNTRRAVDALWDSHRGADRLAEMEAETEVHEPL